MISLCSIIESNSYLRSPKIKQTFILGTQGLLLFRGRHTVPTGRIGDWGAALLPFRGRAKPCSLEEASLLEPLEPLEPLELLEPLEPLELL